MFRTARRRWIFVCLGVGIVFGVPAYFVVQGVMEALEAAERTNCNLGSIAGALHSYQQEHGRLPPAILYDKNGKPLHSWRVLILPFLEAADLYREFRLDEPWDSPHNIQLLPRMPRSYQPPGRQAKKVPPHHTMIRVFVGKGTPFEEGRKLKIPRADEQTILFVEAGEPVPWTIPHELSHDAERPLPELRTFFRDGFRSCLVGASYHFVRKDTAEGELRGLITRKGIGSPGSDW